MGKLSLGKTVIKGGIPATQILARLRDSIRDIGMVPTLGKASKYALQHLTGHAPELDMILVEITTFCNLKCPGCLRTLQSVEGQWDNLQMSLDGFRKIINELPTANEIVTQGIGEPTIHKDLLEMVKIAKASKKFNEITFTTNAMVHKNIDYYSHLFKAGLTTMYISVDSIDQKLANQLRTGVSVDDLKEMIKNLAIRFPEKIAIRTVVGRVNVETIPSLLYELNNLGNLNVILHPYDDLGDASGCLSLEERASFADEIRPKIRQYSNLKISLTHFIPYNRVCRMPWRSPAITADGYLMPCCRILDKDIFNFGNVISESFVKIRSSQKTIDFLQAFEKKRPPICNGCPMYSSW